MEDLYHIRPYEPTDGDGVRALYGTVSGHEPSVEWFDWKFARSPYADNVSMFVAEYGDEIVGIRPYHVIPLCAAAFSHTPYIGWDVIVTDEGEFTVIEANSCSNMGIFQVHRPLLADPQVRRFYEYHSIVPVDG